MMHDMQQYLNLLYFILILWLFPIFLNIFLQYYNFSCLSLIQKAIEGVKLCASRLAGCKV